MTIEFGDIEPEDSWDASDPLRELVKNLCRRLELLGYPCELPDSAEIAKRLDEMVEAHRRARLRAEMIAIDIAFIRGRLHAEGE